MGAFTAEQMKNFDMKNWYDLSGQTAVVTGGSTGLGLAVTRCLVSAGAKVIVLSFESPEQAAGALAEFGDRAAFYQFDITDTDHAQEMADRLCSYGVKGFWNFAPLDLKLPRDASVVNVHLDEGLEVLSFRMKHNDL